MIINATRRLELAEELTAAVPLSLARRYVRLFNPALYNSIFQKYGSGHGTQKYRIYIPVGGQPTADKTVPPPELVAYLATKRMSINDYKSGTALLPDGKRIVRIGKVIADNPTVKKIYDQDPQRTGTKGVTAWVCISRHPYDIIGMSFDRGWTSCMHITDGVNKHYLTEDVKRGTLVAYLVKETDKNINAPSARIALKPYFNIKGSARILVPSTVYGTAPTSFSHVVNTFCTWANSGSPTGDYRLPDKLYDDLGTETIYHLRDVADLPNVHHTQQEDLAENPTTSVDVLAKLAESSNATILRNLIRNENLPEKLLYVIVANPACNSNVYTRIIGDRSTPPEILTQIASKGDDFDKWAIARNPNCPTEVLGKFYADARSVRTPKSDPALLASICDAVISNPNCPPTLLHSSIKAGRHLYELASNEKLPQEIFTELASRGGDVAMRLSHNEATPTATLELLAANPQADEELLGNIVEHPNCSEPLALSILKRCTSESDIKRMRQLLLGRPNVSLETTLAVLGSLDDGSSLDELVDHTTYLPVLQASLQKLKELRGDEYDNSTVITSLLANDAATPAFQVECLDAALTLGVLYQLDFTLPISPAALGHALTLLVPKTWQTYINSVSDIARNENTSVDTLLQVLNVLKTRASAWKTWTLVLEVCEILAVSKKATPDLLREVAHFTIPDDKGAQGVASKLLRNPNTPMDVLQHIRDTVAKKMNSPMWGSFKSRLADRLAGKTINRDGNF